MVSVELESQGRADIHTSVPAIHADTVRTGALGLTGAGVIVGVVDSGIDIFHHAFRKPDGTTRLLSLNDLTAPYTLTATGVPTGGSIRLGWFPPAGQTGSGTQQQTPTIAFDATRTAGARRAGDHRRHPAGRRRRDRWAAARQLRS